MKNEATYGFSATPIDDDIHRWRVRMTKFDPASRLARDLAELQTRHHYNFVELEMSFEVRGAGAPCCAARRARSRALQMDLCPFFPPFVTLIRPLFHGFMSGAIASSPLFKLSYWDPARRARSVAAATTATANSVPAVVSAAPQLPCCAK